MTRTAGPDCSCVASIAIAVDGGLRVLPQEDACQVLSHVPPKATARVLDELLLAMPRWLDRLDELPFDRLRITEKLRNACACRADRLRP